MNTPSRSKLPPTEGHGDETPYDCDFAVNPFHDALQPCAGRIAVPQGPGLGVEPDAHVLEQLRVR